MSDDHKFIFKYGGEIYVIPEGMRHPLTSYIENGTYPGGFLYELLCGNWITAIGAADDLNMPNLPAYANYLYNHAPYNCYGSKEIVGNWMEIGGQKGGSKCPSDQPA